MKTFEYRFYDLEMDFCDQQHGFWLEADEDKRVSALMQEEEKNLGRKVLAEDRRVFAQTHDQSILTW
ncbi:MAG: hypothetical protein WCA81_02950 [Rhizomicrobium sp.]